MENMHTDFWVLRVKGCTQESTKVTLTEKECGHLQPGMSEYQGISKGAFYPIFGM